MRKRSSYRPRPVLLDNMAHVKMGFALLSGLTDTNYEVRTFNHQALKSIVDGTGSRADADVLMAAFNLAGALATQHLGDHGSVIEAGRAALLTCCRRSLTRNRLVFTGPELSAVNAAMELHDAQLDISTVGEIEQAMDLIDAEFRAGRVTRIVVAA